MNTPMRSRVAALAALAALALGGCSTTIDGRAVSAPAPPGTDDVDVAVLDTGNYPTTARPALGDAGNPIEGGLVESRRMATSVLGPWEADPSLLVYDQLATGVVKGPKTVNFFLGSPIGDGLADHNFVAGFSSARHTSTGSYLGAVNVVLRLASAGDAAAAAAAMAASAVSLTFAFADKPVTTQPFSIPRHPETAAVTYRSHDPRSGAERFSVTAITAHGPYVLCQAADSAESAQRAAQLIATTLELQQPLIDKFSPTPVDQLAQLPLDPTGLLAHTLPPAKDNTTVEDGIYDQLGIRHFQGDPVRAQALFKSVGLQQGSYTAAARVYQTADAGAAGRIVAELADQAAATLKPAAGVAGMPKARCFKSTLGYWCVASAARYAFEVQSPHEADAAQMVAAQYRILTGK
ncbi:hypothetical protein [Mycobacterium kansasii]|uniref:DUF7373 family lipoprotein n=1 Tax=Mycobacterium kansasii TaxID=1768 RepID=UPI003A84065B